jgi:hypothetical protein
MNMRRALSVAVTGRCARPVDRTSDRRLGRRPADPTGETADRAGAEGHAHDRRRVRVTDVGGGKLVADVTRPHGAAGGCGPAIGPDLYVIPDEAMPYLAAGVLDRRLFDITGLLAQGTTTSTATDPADVTHGAATPFAVAPAAPAGTTVVRDLPSIKGGGPAPKKARDVWGSLAPSTSAPAPVAPQKTVSGQNVAKVWLDGRVATGGEHGPGRRPGRAAAGLDGTGIRVAVLDTGYDEAHPISPVGWRRR